MESALPFHRSIRPTDMKYSTFLSPNFLIAHHATIGSPISRATPNHKNSRPLSEGYILIPPSHVTTAGSEVPLSECKTSGKFEPPSSSRRPQETNKCPCYLRFVTRARSLFFSRGQRSAYVYEYIQLPWETWRRAQWEQKC